MNEFAHEEYEVFWDNAEGVKSLAGWYYVNAQRILVGPFYTKHSAESQAAEDRDYSGC